MLGTCLCHLDTLASSRPATPTLYINHSVPQWLSTMLYVAPPGIKLAWHGHVPSQASHLCIVKLVTPNHWSCFLKHHVNSTFGSKLCHQYLINLIFLLMFSHQWVNEWLMIDQSFLWQNLGVWSILSLRASCWKKFSWQTIILYIHYMIHIESEGQALQNSSHGNLLHCIYIIPYTCLTNVW